MQAQMAVDRTEDRQATEALTRELSSMEPIGTASPSTEEAEVSATASPSARTAASCSTAAKSTSISLGLPTIQRGRSQNSTPERERKSRVTTLSFREMDSEIRFRMSITASITVRAGLQSIFTEMFGLRIVPLDFKAP